MAIEKTLFSMACSKCSVNGAVLEQTPWRLSPTTNMTASRGSTTTAATDRKLREARKRRRTDELADLVGIIAGDDTGDRVR